MRFFKEGDVIRCPKLFGRQLFKVLAIIGSEYCPMLHCYYSDRDSGLANRVNIYEPMAELFLASKRSLKKLDKITLLKLVAKKNVEARRELKIRINLKKL
jgi:hypothetical protein